MNPNPYPANQTVSNWINASAFAPAAPGTYGNLGYNNLKGPGIFQLNMALSRNFPIGEKRHIQLRAEAFNLPNHLNATFCAVRRRQPDTSMLSNFGQITRTSAGTTGCCPATIALSNSR